MSYIEEFIKTDNFSYMLIIINLLLLITVFFLLLTVHKINNKYIVFMKRLGNGKNLDEMLKKYLDDVEQIKKDNSEIRAYYTKLDNDISISTQKIGLIRYNAFQNVGSDLSFALAILDRENNGVVLNGLYGSESSNIYAKPVKKRRINLYIIRRRKRSNINSKWRKSFCN